MVVPKNTERLSNIAQKLSDNYDDVEWWSSQFLDLINGPFQTRVYPGRSGVDIMDADWDVLIVCDACRADTFERVVDVDQFDSYQRETSKASQTGEWLTENFSDTKHGDTVYVAGNPMVSKWVPEQWHQLIEAWRDGYDPEFAQVHADIITDYAIDALDDYPDKRVIVHYMQPHAPFVNYPDLHYSAWGGFEKLDSEIEEIERGPSSVWHAAAQGLVDNNRVWQAYDDNLDYVMPEVMRLIDSLSEGTKAVITSDHGNVIKKYSYPIPIPVSGHPRYHRIKGLVTVPWAEVTPGRRRVTESSVSSESTAKKRELDERLNALGYK